MEKIKNIEAALVEGMRIGNNGVLKQIYSLYYPVIESLVIKNHGSELEAKDVFQESVILLYEKLQQDEFDLRCSIKTFLYAISKRLWLKRWNEKKTKVFDTEIESDSGDFDEAYLAFEEQEKRFQSMNIALTQLGEPCTTILKDFYINDLSMVDIADKFGYTNAQNAKNQKYKCLQRLKKLFFEMKNEKNELS